MTAPREQRRAPGRRASGATAASAALGLLGLWALAAPAASAETSSRALAPAAPRAPYEARLPPRSTPAEVRVGVPGCEIWKGLPCDNGRHIELQWKWPKDALDTVLIFRAEVPDASLAPIGAILGETPKAQAPEAREPEAWFGDWTLVAVSEDDRFVDTVAPGRSYRYALVTARPSHADGTAVGMLSAPYVTRTLSPRPSYFSYDTWFFLAVILLMAGALWYYYGRVRRAPEEVFIRRIPGVDAIEEAVGRSTEMGRPILYVTGLEDVQDIQTIASLLILGKVAELTAHYDTEIKVANVYPMTMVVAEEIVRQGYANAGRIDAHKPENVMFISAEQFAFAAGVTGLMMRDKPATGIYLGRYFAESLIIAETGYTIKAIQIAGTAEIPQLPFFIAACDYTLIGEELYAVSAYLSREPVLLATLKASDLLKLCIIGIIVVGAIAGTAGWFQLSRWLVP